MADNVPNPSVALLTEGRQLGEIDACNMVFWNGCFSYHGGLIDLEALKAEAVVVPCRDGGARGRRRKKRSLYRGSVDCPLCAAAPCRSTILGLHGWRSSWGRRHYSVDFAAALGGLFSEWCAAATMASLRLAQRLQYASLGVVVGMVMQYQSGSSSKNGAKISRAVIKAESQRSL